MNERTHHLTQQIGVCLLPDSSGRSQLRTSMLISAIALSSFVNGFKDDAMVLFPDQYGNASYTTNVDNTRYPYLPNLVARTMMSAFRASSSSRTPGWQR